MQKFLHKLNSFLNYFNHVKPTLSDTEEKYNEQTFKKDLISGATVSAILIPNVIGYSILAGLPPVMGLYAALPAVMIAALWGSSRYTVTAPVGIVSLLAVTTLSNYATPNTPEFITLAISLAILVGLIQFALGFFKLGIFARLIPHSAIVGFTNAAAILIILSQLPLILKDSFAGFKIHNVFNFGFSDIHVLSLLVGLATVVTVILGKKYFPKLPISLLIILAVIVLEFIFKFEKYGVSLIGYIPSGLPEFSLAAFSLPVFLMLLKQAFLIALVGFVETYSISKSLAKKRDERVNPDKELNGQGLANIFSGLFGGFPVSGSFSASALNFNSGGRSAVSGIVVSFIILLALIFLGPYLSLIPKPVLAGVVIAAISQLISFKELKHIYNVSKTDGVIAIVTGISALIFSPDDALFIGILLAIFFFLYRSMNLKITEVGIHKQFNSLWSRESAKKSELNLFPDKVILRIDYSIIYSNSDILDEMILEKIKLHEGEFGVKVSTVVLNCGGVNYIDLSGVEAMQDICKTLEKCKVEIVFMLVKDVVFSDFKNSGILDGRKYIHGMPELVEYLKS